MVPALDISAGTADDAVATALGGAVFCFFLWPSGSTDGDVETLLSSSFLFLCVFSVPVGFFPVGVELLAVGVLALLFSELNAFANGLNKFLNAEPISPRRRAASSASWAANAARLCTDSSFFSFLSSGFLDDLPFDVIVDGGAAVVGVTLGVST